MAGDAISALSYFYLFNKEKGYMNLGDFFEFLKMFRFEIDSLHTFK